MTEDEYVTIFIFQGKIAHTIRTVGGLYQYMGAPAHDIVMILVDLIAKHTNMTAAYRAFQPLLAGIGKMQQHIAKLQTGITAITEVVAKTQHTGIISQGSFKVADMKNNSSTFRRHKVLFFKVNDRTSLLPITIIRYFLHCRKRAILHRRPT